MAGSRVAAPDANLVDASDGQSIERRSMAHFHLGPAETLRLWINWACKLEAIELPQASKVAELAMRTKSAPDAPHNHKLFIFKGLKLHESMTLSACGVRDGSVLHLVLNEDPYVGRPLFVKGCTGKRRLIACGPDFYIEDIKEELATYQEENTPEETRLIFAGRELQNQHTLREYNVQKPSMLLSLGPASASQQVQLFVAAHSPARDEIEIPLSTAITILCDRSPSPSLVLPRLNPEEEEQQRVWGHLTGPPLLSTFSASNFIVTNASSQQQVEGRIERDEAVQRLTFIPRAPLQHASCYTVTLREPAADSGWLDSLTREAGAEEGHRAALSWDFFTAGYQPLRLTSVYPRPHSRVGPGTPGIILRFNSPIRTALDPKELVSWVSVRGVELDAPQYDAASCALLFPFKAPLRPMQICRVRMREQLVRGARGECLQPLQPDGIVKSSTFRWKFYTGESAQYEEENLQACGLAHMRSKLTQGALVPVHHKPQSLGSLLSPLSPGKGGGGLLPWGRAGSGERTTPERQAAMTPEGSRALQAATPGRQNTPLSPLEHLDPWAMLGLHASVPQPPANAPWSPTAPSPAAREHEASRSGHQEWRF